jgi:hypothetical protein
VSCSCAVVQVFFMMLKPLPFFALLLIHVSYVTGSDELSCSSSILSLQAKEVGKNNSGYHVFTKFYRLHIKGRALEVVGVIGVMCCWSRQKRVPRCQRGTLFCLLSMQRDNALFSPLMTRTH